jgi:hypothetical protein
MESMHDVCMRVLKWLGLVRKHSPAVVKEPVPSEPVQKSEPEKVSNVAEDRRKTDLALNALLPKKEFPLHQYGDTDLHGYIDGTLVRITDTFHGKRVLIRDTTASTVLYQRGGGGKDGYRYINTTTAVAYLLAGRHASWTRTKRINPKLPPTPQNIQVVSHPVPVTLRDYLLQNSTVLKLTPEEIEYLRSHKNVATPSLKKSVTRKPVDKPMVKSSSPDEIVWHYHPVYAVRVNVLGKMEAVSDTTSKLYTVPNIFLMTNNRNCSDNMELGTAFKVDTLLREELADSDPERVSRKRCSLKMTIVNSFLGMTDLPRWADPTHSRHHVQYDIDRYQRKITPDINWLQSLQVKTDTGWIPFTTILATTYAHLFTPKEIEILNSYHNTDGVIDKLKVTRGTSEFGWKHTASSI